MSTKELVKIVGTEHVLTDTETRVRAVTSWSVENFKVRQSKTLKIPEAVVRPRTQEEIEHLLLWAERNRKRLGIIGGGSSLERSEEGDASFHIAVDLSRFDSVIEWDETAMMVQVEAGMTIAALETWLNEKGYTSGQQLRSRNIATIGGAIVTNAKGLFSGKYGSFSDNLQGLYTCGDDYDAEIITGALLGIYPIPTVRAWALLAFEDLAAALNATRLVTRSDAKPACVRMFDINSAARYFGGTRPVVLLGFEGEEIPQAAHYQQSVAVCQNLGGVMLDANLGDTWYEDEKYAQFWSVNANSEKCAELRSFFFLWSEIEAHCAGITAGLALFTDSLRLEICHPTMQGATVEVYYVAPYTSYEDITHRLLAFG
jgi:FAD binding domain